MKKKSSLFLRTISSFGFLFLAADNVAAQEIPEDFRFDTLDEATRFLLGLGVGAGGGNLVSCNLLDFDVEQDDPVLDQLSADLGAHCRNPSDNINSSASLGGSMGSYQATRTVSQYNFSEKLGGSDPNGGPRASFAEQFAIASNSDRIPITGTTFRFGQASFYTNAEFEKIDRNDTAFSDGYSAEVIGVTVGVDYNATERLTIGLAGSYLATDGDFSGSGAFFPDDDELSQRTQDALALKNVSLAEQCGFSLGGDFDGDDYSVAGYAISRFADKGFVLGQAGLGFRDNEYSRNVCAFDVFNAPEEVPIIQRTFAGSVSGEPDGENYQARLLTGYDWEKSGFKFGPRIGGEISHSVIDSYTESESAIGGRTPDAPEGTFDDLSDAELEDFTEDQGRLPSGATLAYEDQDYTSIRSRVGFGLAWEKDLDGVVMTPYSEAYYIHEFDNDQRDIVVRFAGDNRGDDAVRFSFKTDPPDRDFFEFKGGLNIRFENEVQIFSDASGIVGNDLYDSFKVRVGLRLPFN